jgi:hypothetical protein
MAQNFIACDRGQEMLLPPSLTDWLPEDHLVWTVLGAVEQMDLAGQRKPREHGVRARYATNPDRPARREAHRPAPSVGRQQG